LKSSAMPSYARIPAADRQKEVTGLLEGEA
jgi:hypothetical protein